ncbi:MAG: hypothetical protein KatS3mg002_0087 [Candidatus Woesearchaeota archaeon]|nr:MAG: hypothetical protein KatS3mg002_0087 [Candidatus Woesearchaeota archaeon]
MRYTDEISTLKKSPRYKYAKTVFDSLLKGKMPEDAILKKLYKNSYKKIIELSTSFLSEEHGTLRTHDFEAPTLISDARIAVAKNKYYQEIHNTLLNFKIPDISLLKKFFGKYSESVQLSYKLFIQQKKLRKSGISMTCHHNRVAFTVYELNKKHPLIEWYASIAALHDFIEDLMYNLKDEDGNRYTIENYQEFLDKLISKDLQEPVKLLTNHYDMILKYVDYHLERRGKRFNKENVLEFLKLLDYQAYNELRDFIIKIVKIIESTPYEEVSSKDYLEYIKWKCYTELYIPEIVNTSYNSNMDNSHLILLIKIVDLSDNNHGLDSMDQESKIKNIRKSVITSDLIAKLDKDKLLENYIREIREDALVKAEHLVIKDFMHIESCQDFFVDGLLKVRKMKDVFFL